jgi:hypothetical protein
LVVVAFFAFPLLNEGAASACSALEYRALSILDNGGRADAFGSAVMRGVSNVMGGQFGAGIARHYYPNTPPAVACTALYWRSLTAQTPLR